MCSSDLSATASVSDGFIEGCLRNVALVEQAWTEQGALTAVRRARLAETYYMAARHYAGRDTASFTRVATALLRLQPGFRPAAPGAVRTLSWLVGYPVAERLAAVVRRARATARPS